ncbi:MAG: hypothetical protein L0387_40585 [Acidobacteria bacterium]|nr:hypothetical protein [Acidobacteriota bacterium]
MNLTVNSEPESVLDFTRPILTPIFEALEIAAPKAHRVITENGWRNTPQLFSHLVRADAKVTLDGRHCPVDEYTSTIRIVNMGDVAMEGLSTSFEQIGIKVLKGYTMPPAETDARRFFYQHSNAGLWCKDGPPPIGSLLVLWHCTLEGSNLQLDLVCPKNDVDWYWQVRIPHPGEWSLQRHDEPKPDDNLDDLLRPDTDKKKKQN